MSYYGTEPEIIENLERELATAIAQRNMAIADADHFFVLSGKYLQRANDAEAQRDEKDKQLAACYDRMNKTEAQRDKLEVALITIIGKAQQVDTAIDAALRAMKVEK